MPCLHNIVQASFFVRFPRPLPNRLTVDGIDALFHLYLDIVHTAELFHPSYTDNIPKNLERISVQIENGIDPSPEHVTPEEFKYLAVVVRFVD